MYLLKDSIIARANYMYVAILNLNTENGLHNALILVVLNDGRNSAPPLHPARTNGLLSNEPKDLVHTELASCCSKLKSLKVKPSRLRHISRYTKR